MEEWKYSSTILDRGTRWRWVVSLTPQPLYPRYPLDRRLGGPQSWPGRYAEEKNLAPAGNRTPAVQPVARRYTDWVIPTPISPVCSNSISVVEFLVKLFFSRDLRNCVSTLSLLI
jgi:hypothetical protein